MTSLERIAIVIDEMRELQQMAGTGYAAIAPWRMARIIDALELGANACERCEELARLVTKLRRASSR